MTRFVEVFPRPFFGQFHRLVTGDEMAVFTDLTSMASISGMSQLTLDGLSSVSDASEALASGHDSDSRGAIYTRPEVVDFILDLVGYTVDKPLHTVRLLEPSFGAGDFLLRIVERLLTAWQNFNPLGEPEDDLCNAIRAVELHRGTFQSTYEAVVTLLIKNGLSSASANSLAKQWLSQGDFLLSTSNVDFHFVVGNPPYVRQEQIPGPLLAEYRKRFITMYDRADIYVPFFEKSLSALTVNGKLGFICADRWMKNKYGGPLRNMIAKGFRLLTYVDMVDTKAFRSDVIAYPAITVITREKQGPTRTAYCPNINTADLSSLASLLLAPESPAASGAVREIAQVPNGSEPWLMAASNHMNLIRRLELRFPSLEEVGCSVGIGVATGADKAFIGDFESLDVEDDRKLRLVMTKDIVSGEVSWRGQGVINPFADTGGLVDLGKYPRLKKYLDARREIIAGRHCAQKTPVNWYRTIDRITPSLASKPKLLIPDIKGAANIVLEEGGFYPHHNLYYITSEEWDLRALQAVLLSDVTRVFMSTYSTKMQGGFLRYQAQYLRRIRIPFWDEVPKQLRDKLSAAAEKRDALACNQAVSELYGLSKDESAAIGQNGV